MRILITGGGTGGHIKPAIALAEGIVQENPNHEILFVGAKGKMEIEMIRKAGFPIAEIILDGFARFNIFKNFFLPFKYLYSLWKSKKIIKYFNPDIVIGTGGYVSAPILSLASKFKIPIILQEQNIVLGLTNRLYLKKASAIFVAYNSLLLELQKYNKSAFLFGNPVLKKISNSRLSKRKALKEFQLDPNKKCVLVLGGSLGAKTINDSIIHNLKFFIEKDIQLIWQTGSYYYKKIYAKIPKEYHEKIKITPFIDDINSAYTSADVIVARAGAVTISEIAIKKKPAILVPSPNVTNDHQSKNIRPLTENEAILSVEDKNLKANLTNLLSDLLENKTLQKSLSKNINKFAYPEASKKIIEKIIKIPHDISNISIENLSKRFKYAYFIGIGGIGMSSLARWFSTMKMKVYGYDSTPTKITNDLKAYNISVGFEEGVRFIPRDILDNIRETIIIYTPAIDSKNEIFSYIKEKEYSIFKRSDILGKVSKERFTVAIAGTHGKTTITALISHILYMCNRNIIGFIGGIMQEYKTNFIHKNMNNPKSIAIIEADEYDKSFLRLQPNLSIISSVDPDHLDIYKTKKDFEDTFVDFVNISTKHPPIVINKEAYNTLKKKLSKISKNTFIQYNFQDSEVCAKNVQIFQNYVKFNYVRPGLEIKDIKLPLHGYYNIENALAAITVCLLLGLDTNSLVSAIQSFPGLERRFEYIVKNKNNIFINDYAHHPTEILAILSVLKEMYPEKKITVVFQPHLYSRTRDFAKDFAKSLSLADELFLLPIYPAREKPIKNINTKTIFSKVKIKNKFLCKKSDLISMLFQKGKPELLVTLGAGDIYTLVEPIKNYLENKTNYKK